MIKSFIDNDKILMKFLCFFLIIQPFLDIKILFTDPNLQFFGFSIPTLVRCLGVFIMAILSLKFVRKDKEHLFYGIYFVFLSLYFIFHHLIAMNNIELPESYSYSLFSEAFYIIRMLFPFILVYISRHLKISYNLFINIIMITSIFIGSIIVIMNLFHISAPSYAIGGLTNKLNFIEWFTHDLTDYSFESLTSKGWFFMANQISGLIILLIPLNYYELIRKPKIISVLSTLILSISMIIIGTRVATYGLLLIIVLISILLMFFIFIKKEFSFSLKRITPFILVSVVIVVLFVQSPIQNRVYSYGEVEEIEVPNTNNNTGKVLNTKEQYILDNYKKFKIQDAYIKVIYPYTYDADFWVDFFENNSTDVKNNREMQDVISEHIAKTNDDTKYKLFGYSFTRFRSGNLYLENDFLVHFYTIGLFGVILLLGPWIYYIGRGLVIMLANFKRELTFRNCVLVISLVACIGCSIFSGHIMDELIVTLYLGFVCGFFISNYEKTV